MFIQKILFLAAAGAIGTLSRYGLSFFVKRSFGSDFPWGTFVVNIVGCLIVGMFLQLSQTKIQISSETKAIILVGFFGAFTTFSSIIFESNGLFDNGEWLKAAMNIVSQNLVGMVALIVGVSIAKVF